MRVLLIAGGWSPEREVSLSGSKGIRKALQNLGHEVTFFDLAQGLGTLITQAKAHDFAFINLHGVPGEDGLVQAVLDKTGCPYQGSCPAGSLLAVNKAAAKALFISQNIPTPAWQFLPNPPSRGWMPEINFPLFAKANTGGSSLGLFLADNKQDLSHALNSIFAMGEEALLEECILGMEVTCGVLEDKPLPPVLIRPLHSVCFFDYSSKYEAGRCEETCPAPITEELTQTVQKLALQVHQHLNLRDYSRTDFMISEAGEVFVLEVNTLPGMTPTSLMPQEALATGLSFEELVAKLMDMALARQKK